MRAITVLALATLCPIALSQTPILGQNGPMPTAPAIDLSEWNSTDSMSGVIERFRSDRESLRRSLAVVGNATGRAALHAFYQSWRTSLDSLNFDKLGQDGEVDYLLLKNYLDAQLRQGEINGKLAAEGETWVPFAAKLWELREALRRMETIDAERTAKLLNDVRFEIEDAEKKLEPQTPTVKRAVANRALGTIKSLRDELKEWFEFYNGYDPMFTWWCADPYQKIDHALEEYGKKLKTKLIAKPDEEERIPPIGREALMTELSSEMIPYTPEELVEIANDQFAWCEKEMKKASRELGFGDDWKKALESVKNEHVEPGKQPEMIREMAVEAIDFVEKNHLVTVPELAKQTWRMTMMSPERQRVSPFFLGGEVIMVSYPTNTMSHDEKLMSMRGNNRHFARATVQHELIPGHHLQGFMTDRYRPYRGIFSTPFWIEGWALYWEMLLWKMNFPQTPQNRIGMLFWRMHRCARIIFSLSYHLDKMTAEQCVDFLVDRVGHERANADAEVRRSFNGSYPPLYQAAYMLGALQIWRLREELVDTKKMTDMQFHDAILHENSIPIEMLRAILERTKLTKDFKSTWRFYPAIEGKARK